MTLPALAVVAATGITGCAADADSSSTAQETAALGSSGLSQNIERLRALHVFEVSSLQNMVSEDGACYAARATSIGRVCPQDLARFADQIAAGDRRLTAFVEAAEAAAASPVAARGISPTQVDADLEALRNLTIVEVGHFFLDDPEGTNCYQMFCEQSDRDRSSKLHHIVAAAKALP
jgi:hypothetical protein